MDPKAMHKISYGLFVLTARDGDSDNGCIINTAIQAASSPEQISVCVNKAVCAVGMGQSPYTYTIRSVFFKSTLIIAVVCEKIRYVFLFLLIVSENREPLICTEYFRNLSVS